MKIISIASSAVAIFCASQAFAASIDYMAFQDDFNSYSNGAALHGATPPTGDGWAASGTSSLSAASNERANPSPGLSLKQTRGATDYTLLQANPTPLYSVNSLDRVYTLKFDLSLTTEADSTTVALYSGQGVNSDTTIYIAGGTVRYYDKALATYENTGVAVGVGGWASFELEVQNGLSKGMSGGNDLLDANVTLYMSSTAANSLGERPRSAIATWTQADMTTNFWHRIQFGVQANSTVYFDNVEFGWSPTPIPEPAVLSSVALVAAGLLHRRRSR